MGAAIAVASGAMDRLLTMRTFAAVARLSSFTAAAEELAISRTLVSRHIADLEAHLGARLLHRTTRAVTPTSVGYDYLALCRRVLADIDAGEGEIAASQGEVVGEIAIQCPIWLGSFGVSEAAASFCVQHPGARVRIQFEEPSANPHDFLDRGYDLCIQPTALRDSAIMVRKVGEIGFCLIASAAYIARRGEPRTVEELAGHDLLVKAGENDWRFADGTRITPGPRARLVTNSVFSLCSGASAALGIAMVPQTVAERFIREGLAQQVLADAELDMRPLYVAFAPGDDAPYKVRAFVKWLDECLRGNPGPILR